MTDRTSKKKQRAYYSGKKKRHTLKTQVVVNETDKSIVAIFLGTGNQHDFKLFKKAKTNKKREKS
ncbi:hypothetical protein KBC04_03350 [Candidatus Babeliales bacterium]|nr:hypothetical protein [Candidatus Babeliales bacterium]MBP9843912.1 hypothetical protein [Candidatus Babeliales bacterium]